MLHQCSFDRYLVVLIVNPGKDLLDQLQTFRWICVWLPAQFGILSQRQFLQWSVVHTVQDLECAIDVLAAERDYSRGESAERVDQLFRLARTTEGEIDDEVGRD